MSTEARQASQRRYAQSEKGKATRNEARRKYAQSEKGKATRKRYGSQARSQAASIERATRHRQPWTGPQLELAARTDLTAREVALMTGRTYYAVYRLRARLERQPELARLAGLGKDAA